MTCKVCKENKKIEIVKNDFFLRIDSSDKKLNDYKNYICFNCGTIYHSPKVNLTKLFHHYNSAYRNTNSSILLDKKNSIDLPIRFEWTGTSFLRFKAFFEIIKVHKKLKFKKNDIILDYGCYQGAFLYACRKVLKTKVIGTDYNKNGLKMAQKFFDIESFITTKNFYKKRINAKLITLLHVFEHLDEPVEFLYNIKKNVLSKKGYIYLEIPNPYSNPLNDPTHLNLYSEDTIKYILKSTNYELCILDKKESYKNTSLMRNNKELNIHLLAKSIDNNKKYFSPINIGYKVQENLQKKRKFLSIVFVFIKIKFFLKNFFETVYTITIFFCNLISPNLAINFHKILKKFIK
jgi:2-polyprenyl-3-methyl-5-hydroxy-6-metoxy-1,4-benzoquinol methylase